MLELAIIPRAPLSEWPKSGATRFKDGRAQHLQIWTYIVEEKAWRGVESVTRRMLGKLDQRGCEPLFVWDWSEEHSGKTIRLRRMIYWEPL